MRLFNFLAQNGFITSSSNLRRVTELNGVYVNDQLITLKDLNTVVVQNGDKVKVGKSSIVVFGVA